MKGLPGVAGAGLRRAALALLVRGWSWLRPGPAALGLLIFGVAAAAPFLVAHAVQGGWAPVRAARRESVLRAIDPSTTCCRGTSTSGTVSSCWPLWSLLLPGALVMAIAVARERVAGARRLARPPVRHRAVAPPALTALLLPRDPALLHALALAALVLPHAEAPSLHCSVAQPAVGDARGWSGRLPAPSASRGRDDGTGARPHRDGGRPPRGSS